MSNTQTPQSGSNMLMLQDRMKSFILSLGLPLPASVVLSPDIGAHAYNWIIKFENALSIGTEKFPQQLPNKTKTSGYTKELIVRKHFPGGFQRISVENEIGVLAWLAATSDIPVPTILAYDNTMNNPLKTGYILLTSEFAEGRSLSDILPGLGEAAKRHMVGTLVDFVLQVRGLDLPDGVDKIGGLTRDKHDRIVEGPLMRLEAMGTPEVATFHWPEEGEGYDDAVRERMQKIRKYHGPFQSFIDYISGLVRFHMYMVAMDKWETLDLLKDTLPRLEAFLKRLDSYADELNQVQLQFDNPHMFHLDNIIYDQTVGKIVGVAAWDYGGVYPFAKAQSLWTHKLVLRKDGLEYPGVPEDIAIMFKEDCERKGISVTDEKDRFVGKQHQVYKVTLLLKQMVHSIARRDTDKAVWNARRMAWKKEIEEILVSFGC